MIKSETIKTRVVLNLTLKITMSNTDAEVKESDLTDKKWIQVQKKTFTNWINDKLKETNYFVEEITKDLGDGVILIILLYTLAPGKRMPRK